MKKRRLKIQYLRCMMMRPYFLLLLILAGIPTAIQAQEPKDSLDNFYHHKDGIAEKGMLTLGTWGGINLATGLIGTFTEDGKTQYFHQMNAFWGGINLFIAAAAIRSIHRSENKSHTLMKAELDLKGTKRLFLINAGLDILYLGSGYALTEWSASVKEHNRDRVEQYGISFMVQGGFLLGFDLTMYFLHRANGKKRLQPLQQGFSFHGNRVQYNF